MKGKGSKFEAGQIGKLRNNTLTISEWLFIPTWGG